MKILQPISEWLSHLLIIAEARRKAKGKPPIPKGCVIRYLDRKIEEAEAKLAKLDD